jgi:hypothetical protein
MNLVKSNPQQVHGGQGFIPWFSSPQKFAYIHIVEEAIKA